MREWIGRRLGITAELVERMKHVEQVAAERAQQEPHVVMRKVLVLEPRQRCIQWYNQWSRSLKDHGDATLPADRERFLRAYQVPPELTERDLEHYIAGKRDHFLQDFVLGFAPRSRWPWAPTDAEFDGWFGVSVVPIVWDLVKGPIGKEPDLVKVAMRDF